MQMGSQVRCNYAPGKVGRFPHDSSARQGGRISTAAAGKVGLFPHGSGARQGGPIPTQHRRAARWADSHTTAAPGKVGGFPHSTGARQGGPIPTRQRRRQDGRISTQHRRPARWADSHTTAAPGKMGGFPYRHVCSLCYPWIVQLSGSLVVWRSVPVTGRVRPLTRSTAPRPEGGPPFPRAGARRPLRTPVGTYGSCVAVSGIRALQGGAGSGDTFSIAVSGDLRPVPV
jgi:hypothetical protein